ncbi:MAG: glycosyltransferase, partial [Candidatus Cyclobacteriaceae bacterium M3_2C_046]
VSKTVVNSLSVFSNVELLPPVAPEHLGATMGNFSIGIIPFVKNEFTRHIYPLKINEYLALGLPVITTSFSNLAAFGDIIKIADQTEEFITAIQNELKSDSIAQMTFRKKIASQNSWANRAKQLNQVISRQKGAERDAAMV